VTKDEKVLLVVDLSNQTYRACHVHAALTSASDEFTGGLYGFLSSIAKVIHDTQATHCVVAEDRRPYKRSELYPLYKQLRKSAQDPKLKERVEISKLQILEALKVIGIPSLGVPGFEFDDIAGHFSTKLRHRFKKIVLQSNDGDLFQLLRFPSVVVHRKGGGDVIDARMLMRLTGWTPEQHTMVTALMGTHNDVAGIPGVAEKTADKILRSPELMAKYRASYGEVIERNLKLIKLPYDGFPEDLPLPGPTRSFVPRDLYRYCAQYDITATKTMLDSFERVAP